MPGWMKLLYAAFFVPYGSEYNTLYAKLYIFGASEKAKEIWIKYKMVEYLGKMNV